MAARKEQVGRSCPFCGAVVTQGEYFCRSCHRKFDDHTMLDSSADRHPGTVVVALRMPDISALLAATGPGLGQFYNGDTAKGLVFLFAFGAVSFSLVSLPFPGILAYGVWIAAIAEAFWSAGCINRYERQFAGVSPLLYVLLAIYAVVIMLCIVTGIPDAADLARVFPVVQLAIG